MEEIWKDIYFIENGVEWDYRGLYQVSNLGQVKSLKRIYYTGKNHTTVKIQEEHILKYGLNKQNYRQVTLSKNGKTKNFRINRLVAYMFIENDDPINKTQVNHKDENKENNNINNLEWCTPKENCNYGTRNKRMSNNRKHFKNIHMCGVKNSRAKAVAQYDLDGNLIKIYNTFKEVFNELGIKHQGIHKCCVKKYKTSSGFIWRYLSDVIDENGNVLTHIDNK